VLLALLFAVRVDAAVAPPLKDLPITEVPATRDGKDVFAVLVSGDGGWARLDQELSAELAGRGIPVAGLDSLHYFWHTRTPEETAADVSRIIEHYSAQWHRPRVLLIGYSFGADLMPSVFNRLPAPSRARVVSLSLLGLAKGASYEVRASEWIPALAPKGTPVKPEIRKISTVPILCVEGEAERKSICPALQQPGVEVRQIGHKHHFSYLESEIADAVLSVARVAPTPGVASHAQVADTAGRVAYQNSG
jgi:type IV secretory pathway VirJ component